MSDLVEKLQNKTRTYKKQIEDAEEIAALNLAKFRKAQQQLEEVTLMEAVLVLNCFLMFRQRTVLTLQRIRLVVSEPVPR